MTPPGAVSAPGSSENVPGDDENLYIIRLVFCPARGDKPGTFLGKELLFHNYLLPTKANRVRCPTGSPNFSNLGNMADVAVGRRAFLGQFHLPRPYIPPLLHLHFIHPLRRSKSRFQAPTKTLQLFPQLNLSSIAVNSQAHGRSDVRWLDILHGRVRCRQLAEHRR
ncbi:hypothetical protein PR048_002521 [Dryococelus australis]|uniref:Uncharacterized protein n=1 Tax=Dryococelus australis TaxID=614101 RepID=A0ABQ9ILW7_9NEOP|nr:hypothetical protein PR048_002521 [Dryococelus australis]